MKRKKLGWSLSETVSSKILMTGHSVYVDCFSGKGRFDDGKPGSPMIAFNVRKECMEIYGESFKFCENSKSDIR